MPQDLCENAQELDNTMDLTSTTGCKIAGSKFWEDCRSPQILRTWSRSSSKLFCSESLIVKGLTVLPLETRAFIKPGRELYVSITLPRTTASVTRTASFITKALRFSPSGANNSFKTGCNASCAEKSLSFLPWTSKFSSLFHLLNQNWKSSVINIFCF